MEEIGEDISDGWNEPDQRFFAYEDDIAALLVQYVKANMGADGFR